MKVLILLLATVLSVPAFAQSVDALEATAKEVALAYVHATWDSTAEVTGSIILSRNAKVRASALKSYQAERLKGLVAIEVTLIDGGHDKGSVIVYTSPAGKVLAVVDGDSFTP